MTFLETLGLVFLLWLGGTFAIFIYYYGWRFVSCWRRKECYSCWGAGGHVNLLLVFAREDWEKCDKCNGTGKR